MKKRMFMLMAALLAAVPLNVNAASTVTPQTSTTKINASVNATYTLTIPSATTITFGQETTKLSGELKVTGNVENGQSVQVTVKADPLHNDSQNTDISYQLLNGTNVFGGAIWSEDELRTGLTGNAKEIQLSVRIPKEQWDNAKAGLYEGAITFTATLTR